MKYKKLILCLISLLLVVGLITYNAICVAPHKLTIREETLKSDKFDKSLDGLTIAFFSDVHYGNFINDDDIDKLIDTINLINPDVVIFGGDLIDRFSQHPIPVEQRELLSDKLSNIKAKIDKYAVLGNHDEDVQPAKDEVNKILTNAGFKVIENTNVQISNGTDKCINLIGIDSMLCGTPDIASAYEGIADGNYTIAISHCPDIFDEIDTTITDYVLSAHSHGGQVYLPLINIFYRPYGCEKYFRGKHHSNNATLDITNGSGLTNKSIRLFADAEVVFYKLEAN